MTVHSAIYDLLSRGNWYAPHEIEMQLKLSGVYISGSAVTARVRDLRKVKFGDHDVVKRLRAGESYYEYRVISKVEQVKAA